MPSEIIIIVIESMFFGVYMFLALLRTHFSEPESGQKHIYAREHQLSCYITADKFTLNNKITSQNAGTPIPHFPIVIKLSGNQQSKVCQKSS